MEVDASEVRNVVMPMLTLNEAAAELRVSRRWLEIWLAGNAVDTAGVPFYVPMGRRKKFAASDIDRMLAHMRALEAARLGPSVKGKARLVGLLSQGGGNEAPRKQAPLTGYPGVSAELLGELAVASVMGTTVRRTKPPQRRVRWPRAKKPEPPGG
jgi:hypothetical protein